MATSIGTTIWYPGDIILGTAEQYKAYGLVVLNQPLKLPAPFYAQLWKNSCYHIGADGGANRVFDLHPNSSKPSLGLDTVIGDLDSLHQEARDFWLENGSEIIYDQDQYSTDFTKAIRYLKTFQIPQDAELTASKSKSRQAAIQKVKDGPEIRDIVCLGGLGGRVDQGISTLHHLYIFQKDPTYSTGKVFLISNEAITFVLQAGEHRIQVKTDASTYGLGKHIGIMPLKEPSVITTTGLRWDVTDWPTEFGGQMSTSNHVKDEWVTIKTTKDILFTINLDITS